ncbi:Uncharacterised protein [Serratia rubidaea]|uniref:Uncharacterized protein n=1 Tax=Serratia rubidaea TaxID=61652 RepID=A0A3S4JU87_SERRU|nr:Uncharacterised protein [Serratia rubidaea]
MAQRQNTTLTTGWPDISTNQPIEPEISIAATISSEPRFISAFIVCIPCVSNCISLQPFAVALHSQKQAYMLNFLFIKG